MSRRKDFSVTIRGTVTFHRNGKLQAESNVTSATAAETTSGTSRRKPAGWIPPTPYSFDRKVTRARNGRQTRVRSFDGRTDVFVGPLGTYGSVANDAGRFSTALSENWLTSTGSLRDKALVKARSKMKNGDVNLGIAFAERNRTAQLVTDTATSLVKSLRSLRRGNWRDAWRHLGSSRRDRPKGDSIPRKWLEMQYGWKPLLSDVYGSVDALSRQPPRNWIVTGTGIEQDRFQKFSDESSSNDLCDVDVRAMRGVFCRIDAVPENDLLMALSSLGITNPLQVAWELVPFSFMADWFLPIGSFLESLDAMLGYGNAWYSESHLSRGNWKVLPKNGTNGNFDITWNCSAGTKEIVRLRRSVSNSVPLPTMPRLRDGRSLTRMANALSILASNMR